MKIYDESNDAELLAHHDEKLADGTTVGVHVVGGHKRYLARVPTMSGRALMAAAPKFADSFPTIDRAEWPERIKEQKAKKRRVSDFQYFAPHDQDGLPTCWANGPAHAFTTMRVIQGLPLVYISACSLAVPISGGHVGGDEWDAGHYLQKYGGASFDAWDNNDTSRSLDDTAAVNESRKRHMAFNLYAIEGSATERFNQYATACLYGWPSALAFNRWSHVISGGDLGQDGSRFFGWNRNNWGDWGENNDLGMPGYIAQAEGSWTPDSGIIFAPVMASVA